MYPSKFGSSACFNTKLDRELTRSSRSRRSCALGFLRGGIRTDHILSAGKSPCTSSLANPYQSSASHTAGYRQTKTGQVVWFSYVVASFAPRVFKASKTCRKKGSAGREPLIVKPDRTSPGIAWCLSSPNVWCPASSEESTSSGSCEVLMRSGASSWPACCCHTCVGWLHSGTSELQFCLLRSG